MALNDNDRRAGGETRGRRMGWGTERDERERERDTHDPAGVTDYSCTFTRQPFPGLFRGGLERGPNSQLNRYNFVS